MEELLSRDFGETLSLIWEIVIDPASRPVEAMLVFGIIVVLLAILFLVVLLFVARSDEDAEDEGPAAVEPEAEWIAPSEVVSASPPRAPRRRVPAGLIIVLGLFAWWILTGVSTAAPPVCLSCHVTSDHVATRVDEDPHEGTGCVRCHERGGVLASLTTAVPRRVEHIVSSMLAEVPAGSYGYVGSAACESCHARGIAETTTNDVKAVKVSHEEPLQAGAQCLDCHTMFDGVIGVATTKMKPCLRCHDGVQAPSECEYCHTGDIALAVSGRSEPSTATAQALVADPQCGGCHSQESCDACHGVRLPHTGEFMAYAHAREGVEDIWYNGGATCGKCHYDGNNPCTDCHTGRFPSHGTSFRVGHGASGAENTGCDTCHAGMAYRRGRDFCVDLCHTERFE